MKIGMIFPGYGSQYVGMGKELYDNSRIMQEYFEEASHCLSINFVKLCFASSDIELSKITHAYPALFLVGVATAAVMKAENIMLDCVAGYGVGELSAICAAGGVSFPDGLYFMSKLSQFYLTLREQLDIKSIIVNGLSARKLRQICKEHSSGACCAQIAIYENKTEHRVSGHGDAIDAIVEHASDAGAQTIKPVTTEEGLHTPLLNELAQQLEMYLTKVDFKDMHVPLITNVDAQETCLAQKAQNAIMRQIVEPLYWHNVIKQFAHIDTLVVPAPSKVLMAELKNCYPDKYIIAIETMDDILSVKTRVDALASVKQQEIAQQAS